jgi:tubulin monoglycylase TTLL3/8
MTGLYPCVKDEFIRRGWYYNTDPDSPFFDLKWTLKSGDIDQVMLKLNVEINT